jgi:pyruvate formate lyase activating enzyme
METALLSGKLAGMVDAPPSLAAVLESLTARGELYTPHPDGSLTCYACGHRCLIRPGRRGICQVRFNQGGELRVPFGYVGALQCDPTEKKPFFHIYPGSDTLTFGMLGCDLHCAYCFPPDTVLLTDRGPLPIAAVFKLGERFVQTRDALVAIPLGLRTVAASGNWRSVVQMFKHSYQGELVVIKPYYLPEVRCTPNHGVYATLDPAQPPQKTAAAALTADHFLAVPRCYEVGTPQCIDVAAILSVPCAEHKTPHKLPAAHLEYILAASAAGVTSRELGAALGKHPSYIRHVRSKVRRGLWRDRRVVDLVVEAGRVRFAKEHRPGLPAVLPIDAAFARLLGYYCAEGSVIRDADRPNSYALVFAFGRHEKALAEEVRRQIEAILGIKARLVLRETTLAVTVSKSSAALLFRELCGARATGKRVPPQLFEAPVPVVEAFLAAYWQGAGHRYANGKLSATTKSRALAYGLAGLALRTGHRPSIYDNAMPAERLIDGRAVRQAPPQYTVAWYGSLPVGSKAIETDHHFLIPIRELSRVPYSGDVYNLEVDVEHTYLAGLIAVSNCQNWITSQVLRDPASEQAGARPQPVTPEMLVDLALQRGAQLVGSSYNEPLITSEWAVAVFRQAVAAGLKCVYISNGNATPEVLEYIRPYVSGYKIDLKTMSDKNYRKLGAVLQNVLDGLRAVHALGFWLEVVTLVIPGFNDSTAELMDAARFLASLSPDIPWHVTAFHQDYKMTAPDDTGAVALIRAAEIGQEAGLRYVYAGNLPGQVGDYEHTFCPACRRRVIARFGYRILDYALTADGACPGCGTRLPGIWTHQPEQVRRHGPGAPRPLRSVINGFRSDLAR